MKKENIEIKYEKAIINFTYTFSWDVSKIKYPDIISSESSNEKSEWLNTELFNRPLCHNDNDLKSTYHPNIMSKSLKVFHRQFCIDENAVIINKDDKEQLKFKLNCTIRFNENGTGICTFTSILNEEVTFKKIHQILHLATTINSNSLNAENNKLYIKNKTKYSLKKDQKSITLISFFNEYITNEQSSALPKVFYENKLFFDSEIISFNEKQFSDWQTPFTTTFLEVDKESYTRFREHQDKDLLKEFISIAGRLSSANKDIKDEYLKILREYVFRSYKSFYFDSSDDDKRKSGMRIKNYSHHKDLFYTIDKRGAIAITHDFESNPSFFVLPTFMNLVEILRSRWHIGSIVNLKLDELFEELSENSDLSKIQNEIFKCRKLYGLFLKDPAPYLFDGGAITEIAITGDEIFWLSKLSTEMDNKLKTIDKLIDDLFLIKQYKEFTK